MNAAMQALVDAQAEYMSRIGDPMASGYGDAGASVNRRAFKGFSATSASPNEDINWHQSRLRQRSRMLVMSSPVAASAIKTNRTKVVGVGLGLKCSVDSDVLGWTPEKAKDWQRHTEREFRLWSSKRENCDAIGLNTFSGLQALALSSFLTNGDVIGLKEFRKPTPLNPYRLRIHMVEADRVSTPNVSAGVITGSLSDGINKENGNRIYDGVEVDSNGMVVAYWICNVYPNQVYRDVEKAEWVRVLAYGRRTGLPNVYHVLDTERPDQYRGVSYLAPVIESLLNISRYTQSELMAALVQSFFTAWIKTKTNPAEIPVNEVSYGEDEDPNNPPDSYASDHPNEYEMGPGTVLHLEEDEEVVFGNPNIPSSGFDAFFKVICKEIGAALEIPYDTLLKEFNSSYSASRAALMEAWEGFEMRRKLLVDQFCQPVYEAWLAEAVAIGRIQAPGFFSDPAIRAAYCKAQWLGPVQGQLDPTKEVEANIMAVQHGFKTREQVTREYGGNWLDNMEQARMEVALMKEVGLSGGTEKALAQTNEQIDNPGGDQDGQT